MIAATVRHCPHVVNMQFHTVVARAGSACSAAEAITSQDRITQLGRHTARPVLRTRSEPFEPCLHCCQLGRSTGAEIVHVIEQQAQSFKFIDVLHRLNEQRVAGEIAERILALKVPSEPF